jgi:hypothetical protein
MWVSDSAAVVAASGKDTPVDETRCRTCLGTANGRRFPAPLPPDDPAGIGSVDGRTTPAIEEPVGPMASGAAILACVRWTLLI